jgi:hypothetical protein
MSDVSAGSAPGSNRQYTDAIQSYRSIAKWVVSTFGAVGAAFVVGLSLNTLGGLSEWRVVMSIICIVVGFGAIVFAIEAATAVLEPSRVTFDGFEESPDFEPLRTLLKDDPSPLDGEATTAQGLAAKLEEFEKHEGVAREYADEHPENPVAARRVREREQDVGYLYEKVSGLALLGQMLLIKKKYLESKKKIYGAVVAAGLAAIGFAFASNPPHHETPSTTQATVKPQIHVSVGGPRLLDWPRSCARLYFVLDKLATAEPRVGPLWPAGSLSDWDRACGLRSRADVARALAFFGRRSSSDP